MTWLSGWGKRIKLTLDSFRVDEDLTDFPVLITLASGTGKNSADVTSVFDELDPNAPEYVYDIDDSFAGTSLDSVVWGTFIQPNASVTVNNELQLNNQTGSSQSGAYCYTKTSFNKTGIIKLVCKWKPHKLHYSGVATPSIKFCKPDARRDGSYGTRDEQFVAVQLGYQNDSINRTRLRICDAGTNANVWLGTVRNDQTIDIDENQWHDLEVIIDTNTRLCTVDLDSGTYNFNATIDSTNWSSIGTTFVLEFGSSDRDRANTERFKDVFLNPSEYDSPNNKKIMLTKADGVSPCYVEIERWNAYNEQAWLWAKVPTIVSGTDTDLYLYYDKTKNDNDHYIGDTGEEAAKNVWDSDFVGVWHMTQDPYGGTGAIKDSTRIANHGTPGGSMTPADLVGGKVGKALDFDGTDDFVNFGSATNLDDIIIKTLEITTYLHAMSPSQNSVGSHIITKGDLDWFIATSEANSILIFGQNFDVDNGRWSCPHPTLNVWHCIGVTYDRSSDGNDPIVYVDASLQTIDEYATPSGIALSDAANDLLISKSPNYDRCVDGVLDEVRVSNIDRSAAWIKATYYSNWNNFVTFGAEEEEPVYYLDGFVKERNQPVSRVVKLYRRDTGVFVDSDTSRSSDGYYYLTTPSSGTHFIIAFDDDAGDEFNALILDKVSVKGTV